jgi:hypothetical protein
MTLPNGKVITDVPLIPIHGLEKKYEFRTAIPIPGLYELKFFLYSKYVIKNFERVDSANSVRPLDPNQTFATRIFIEKNHHIEVLGAKIVVNVKSYDIYGQRIPSNNSFLL